MPIQGIQDLSRKLPNYLSADQEIIQTLLYQFDQMIAYHQGFLVMDYTGHLTQEIFLRMPKERAKDCRIVHFDEPKRCFGLNLLERDPYLTIEDQTRQIISFLNQLNFEKFTAPENKLLTHALCALLEANKYSKGKDDVSYNIFSLMVFLEDEHYRHYAWRKVNLHRNRKFWQNYSEDKYRAQIEGLHQKLKYLFLHPEYQGSLITNNRLDFDGMNHGKMFFVQIPQTLSQALLLHSKQLALYLSNLTIHRAYKALQSEDLLKSLVFINHAHSSEGNLKPSPNCKPNQHMQEIVRQYSRMKDADKREINEGILGVTICEFHDKIFTKSFDEIFAFPKGATDYVDSYTLKFPTFLDF